VTLPRLRALLLEPEVLQFAQEVTVAVVLRLRLDGLELVPEGLHFRTLVEPALEHLEQGLFQLEEGHVLVEEDQILEPLQPHDFEVDQFEQLAGLVVLDEELADLGVVQLQFALLLFLRVLLDVFEHLL